MHKPRILAEFLLPGVPATGSPPYMLARTAKQDNEWHINLPRPKKYSIPQVTGNGGAWGSKMRKRLPNIYPIALSVGR